MWQEYVGAIIRALLIATGVITAKDADGAAIQQLAGAVIAIATVAWSLYQKRQSRAEKVSALSRAGLTENENKAMVKDPAIPTPSVSTSPDVVPQAVEATGPKAA